MFCHVWGFGYDETVRRNCGFTKEDSRKLQVLQNKVCRMKTGLGYDVSTEQLMKASKDLSVHQLTAYHTLVTVHKVKTSHKPKYLDDRLKYKQWNEDCPQRQLHKIHIDQRLNLARAGFIYRGGHLWNQLPDELRTLSKTGQFKKRARCWVEQNVKIKPG